MKQCPPAPVQLNRRTFLLRSLKAVGALVVAPALMPGCGASRDSFVFDSPPSGLPFGDLSARLEGTLLQPGDPSFFEIARPWNLRYADRIPAAIARCESVRDIATSLRWAQDNGAPFVVRSGGHSYSGFSTTSGLLIDISPLRSVAFDQDTGRATFGPGARNQTVYDSLRPLSRSVTHGRCAEVGLAGLVLGGGIGFNMRLHGLTCDQLVETTILLADGRHLTLNENENSDLFWACRGAGGGNFGIHTSFTMQTFPVDQVTYFKIDWRDNLDAVLPALMNLLPGAPRELGAKITVSVAQENGTRGPVNLDFFGQLRGTPDTLRAFLQPVYDLASPVGEDIRLLPYWEAQDELGEDGEEEFSYERSRIVDDPIAAEGFTTILSFLRSWPGLEGSADWKMFLAGGAVSDVPPHATAYVHRQALGVSSVELEWHEEQPEEVVKTNRAWVDEFHQAMAAYTSHRSYQNFIDVNQEDYLRAYYGSNLERLVEVKRKYDPHNVFNYPQSIPVAL